MAGTRDAGELLEELVGPLTFGKMISAIRLCDELSVVAFATKLGIAPGELVEIEAGRGSVTSKQAAKWARILGYSEPQFVRYAARIPK